MYIASRQRTDSISKPFSKIGEKYDWFLELVDGSETLSSRAKVERLFIFLGGPKKVSNTKLLNKMLIDWQRISKMKKPDPKTKSPFHRPVSNNQRIRTFFASVKKQFNWEYALTDFEGFDGCFGNWMAAEYERRAKAFVSLCKKFMSKQLPWAYFFSAWICR